MTILNKLIETEKVKLLTRSKKSHSYNIYASP